MANEPGFVLDIASTYATILIAGMMMVYQNNAKFFYFFYFAKNIRNEKPTIRLSCSSNILFEKIILAVEFLLLCYYSKTQSMNCKQGIIF